MIFIKQRHSMADYPGEDRRAPIPPPQLGWHLKREVNLTIIISVIGIAVAVVTGYSDLKKDIELIKADVTVLHQRDSQQADSLTGAMAGLQRQFDRLDNKLDRLIERGKP